MKFWIGVVGSLMVVVFHLAEGQNTDPQLTMQRYVDAQNLGDLEVALGLWADDGMIVNTRGRSVIGKENRFNAAFNRAEATIPLVTSNAHVQPRLCRSEAEAEPSAGTHCWASFAPAQLFFDAIV
jgi:hypothetical protein